MERPRAHLDLQVLPQPDDTTCGPTCLHALYAYWGDSIALQQLISEIPPLPDGGTLAVTLACHALARGYNAEIFTYNLQLFDPTWFVEGVDLEERLRAQLKAKQDPKLGLATDSYLEFLRLGGTVQLEELTAGLLLRFLNQQIPILTGLSATYLYRCAREQDDKYNDVSGEPTGHFVILSGCDRDTQEVVIADPLHDNPGFGSHKYTVSMDRLLASILLGIVTYDANLLIITPKSSP